MTISRTVIILLALLAGFGVFAGRGQEPMAQANAAPPNTAKGQLARIEALEKGMKKLRKRVLALKRAHKIRVGDAEAISERKRERAEVAERLLAEVKRGGGDDGGHAAQLLEKFIRADMAKGTWRGVRSALLSLVSFVGLQQEKAFENWKLLQDQLKAQLELHEISIREHERLSKGIQAWSKEHVDENRASFAQIDDRLKLLRDAGLESFEWTKANLKKQIELHRVAAERLDADRAGFRRLDARLKILEERR